MSHPVNENPVIETAKEQKPAAKEDKIHTLESGVRVQLHGVSQSLLLDVTRKIAIPEVPVFIKDGKEYPNPLDPSYGVAKERYEQDRGAAAFDAVMMFGVELVDGMPEDDLWLRKLALIGIEIDDDPITREFYYKKYIALGNDLQQLQDLMGISQEDVDAAKKSLTSPGTE
jgi:hypothetical protein